MSPERREKLRRCLVRLANLTPCVRHVAPVVYETEVESMSDEQLLGTFQSFELILDEALGTDVG